MSVNLADLKKAIVTLWNTSGLEAMFVAMWDASVTAAEHAALRDSEAPPGDPLPYCVLETTIGNTVVGMAGMGGTRREIRDQEVVFSIHARSIDGDARTPDMIASDLAEEITKVFGGHPTVSPSVLVLDVGNFLAAFYQGDVGIKTGEDEYQCRVTYLMRIDVPVAT